MKKKYQIDPGDVFGRLRAVSYAPVTSVSRFGRKTTRGYWTCVCSCGRTTKVLAYSLSTGATLSCGCHGSDLRRARMTVTGHASGGKQSKTYMAWRDMIQRCSNKNNPSYHNYGGRGIRVCRRWLSFENFLADMGEAPKGLTLDRVNVNKNYTKSNCEWATWHQQSMHKRAHGTELIEFMGQSLSPSEWSDKLGLSLNTIYSRRRSGRPAMEILSKEKLNRRGRSA